MEPNKIYVTVKMFAKNCSQRGWPTEAALRKIIFEREHNGYKTAIIHHGKRVFIEPTEFWKCFEARGEK